MTLDEFRQSLAATKPPAGLTQALAGLWWEAKGDWKRLRPRLQYLSSLWKVTRSIKPKICSVEGLRSGVAAFMRGFHFAMTGVLRRRARTRFCSTSQEMREETAKSPAAPRGVYRRGSAPSTCFQAAGWSGGRQGFLGHAGGGSWG